MSEILRPAEHRCSLPYSGHGLIVRCTDCGQVWRRVEPGNPSYAGWVRVGRLELRIRMWFAARNTRRHS